MRFGQISRVIGDQVRIIQDLDVLKVHIINFIVSMLVFLELTNRYTLFLFTSTYQWKALPDAEKAIYEEKCKELNKENARKYAADHSLADEQ